MRDDVIEVPESDYSADIAKYMELASGDTMVCVMGKDGEAVLVLGWGKPTPMTEEEKAADKAFLAELFSEPESDGDGDARLNSWLD